MNRRRSKAVLPAVVVLLLLLTGCWDVREMNHLALVMAVGIDKADTTGRFQVTIQIARPSGVGRSGNASGGQGQGPPVYVATADGDTLYSAIRNLAQFTSRRIMWAHNNVIVVGESLAREDITPVVDFFTRNQELRMRTWIVVTHGTDARSIVTAPTGMEDVPANSISALLRYAQLPGESVPLDVSEVAAAFFAKDLYPVMPSMVIRARALKPSENREEQQHLLSQAELAGTGIFHRTRLVGFVDRETGRGLLWLRRQMKNAVISVACPGDPERNVALEIRTPKVDVKSYLGNQVPRFHVAVDTRAWVSEQDCETPTTRTSTFKDKVERELAAKIESEMGQTMKALQEEMETDAVQFARVMHIQHPDWWRTNGAKWDQIFPKVKMTYSVTVKIDKMGLYNRPMGWTAPQRR